MKEYVAAVDLGGTKIALGLFDEACTLVAAAGARPNGRGVAGTG